MDLSNCEHDSDIDSDINVYFDEDIKNSILEFGLQIQENFEMMREDINILNIKL